MPQMFQVLRCYKCLVFQVHQIRKDNKWVCKMCGEKQSVKRHYALGTGKDCRLHVQKLNKLRGEREEISQIINSDDSDYDDNKEKSNENITNKAKNPINEHKESKWAVFIDNPTEKVEESEPAYYNDREVLLEIPKKRKNNRNFKQSKCLKKSIHSEVNCGIDASNNNKIDKTPTMPEVKPYISDLITKKVEISFSSRIESLKTVVENKNHKLRQFESENINKASKWEQFLDAEETLDKNNENGNLVGQDNNKNPFFSLCDDNEIDTILNF